MVSLVKRIFSKKARQLHRQQLKYSQERKKIESSYLSGDLGIGDVIGYFSGEKFAGGWGKERNYEYVDLYKMQKRSRDLFRSNAFAETILGRLDTSVINSGLWLESKPIYNELSNYFEGSEEDLEIWAENVETLFSLWGDQKELVDLKLEKTFAGLQKEVYRAANLSGDVLIVENIGPDQLPRLQLIDGVYVRTPAQFVNGINERRNKVCDGIELDKQNRHLGYYVHYSSQSNQISTEFSFIPAYGKKSKRRVAWLYGNGSKTVNDVRSMPILGTILQNLNEIDKYLDSEQRAALLNSMIAIAHTAGEGTGLNASPFAQGAVRRTNTDVTQDDGTTNNLQFEQYGPGMIVSNLQSGEEIKSFANDRPNVNFGKYIETAIKIMSMAKGIPPEIFFLEFNNNYSASRQATIEFNIKIKETRAIFQDDFLKPVYFDWFIGMVLTGKIDAPGFVDFIRDRRKYWVEFGSYLNCSFRGVVKENVDLLKQVKALSMADQAGYLTSETISNEYFNTSYRQNIRRKYKENIAMAEARRPLENAAAGEIESENEEIEEMEDQNGENAV
jgi:capsid protein